MGFSTPAFIRKNTPELRKKLSELGYKVGNETYINDDFLAIDNNEIFGLAKHLNIDLLWHIEQKMRYNELRENKHGKMY